MSKKRLAQLVGLMCVVGAVTGVLAATVFGGSGVGPNPSDLDHAMATAPTVTVAAFPDSGNGKGHVVLVQRLQSLGLVCVWDAAADGSDRGGGCNDAADPLAGKAMTTNTASSTGPNGNGYTVIRISGLTSPRIATVEVRMSDGSSRTASLAADVPAAVSGGPTSAFTYAESDADLSAGLVPTAVVGLDRNGTAVETDAVGLSPHQ